MFYFKNRPKLPMSYFTKEEKTLRPPIIIRRPQPVSTELQKWMVTHPRKRIWTSHEISASGRELCHPRENYEPNWFIDPYLLLLAKLSTVFGKESQNKNHSRKTKTNKNTSPETFSKFCSIFYTSFTISHLLWW